MIYAPGCSCSQVAKEARPGRAGHRPRGPLRCRPGRFRSASPSGRRTRRHPAPAAHARAPRGREQTQCTRRPGQPQSGQAGGYPHPQPQQPPYQGYPHENRFRSRTPTWQFTESRADPKSRSSTAVEISVIDREGLDQAFAMNPVLGLAFTRDQAREAARDHGRCGIR